LIELISMILRPPEHSGNARGQTRGVAAVAMVVILLMIDLIVVGLVVGLGRDHNLTVHRLQTIESMYAAEAGMNMSIREMMISADEDGDGTIGTISDDSDDGTDPTLGNARFVVTATADTPYVGQTTLTSMGRSDEARRKMETIME
jgi:hypothetical protein